MGPTEEPVVKVSPAKGWKTWSKKKKALVLGLVFLFVVALAVGLGAGLALGLDTGDDSGDDTDNEFPPDTGNDTTVTWQPAVGTSWQIVLRYPLNDTSFDADVYDIDLFDNEKEMIDKLHSLGRKVICYFSAGTSENWREDFSRFNKSVIGKRLDEWKGENWVDISSSNVRKIMQSRLDLAQEKGCDGVDPDNVDGYDNDNGLDLTKNDTISYVRWLAGESHARNMSIGLKNAGAIIDHVIGRMQWSVNEQCAQYNECNTYAKFVNNGKPVFHIEYPKGDEVNNQIAVTGTDKTDACDFDYSNEFSTVIKNMDLDNWIQTC